MYKKPMTWEELRDLIDRMDFDDQVKPVLFRGNWGERCQYVPCENTISNGELRIDWQEKEIC